LHNLSADKEGFDVTAVYDMLELKGVPRKDERVQWMVDNCLQRGYIKPVGDSGRINMTICGHELCLHHIVVKCLFSNISPTRGCNTLSY